MSGFFAPEADWWRVTREHISKPWPRETALIDLRWWQDQVLLGRERRTPSHRDLGEHWGWGEKKARLLLEREEEWSDPAKAERWRAHRGHTRGTVGAHRGHTEGTRDAVPVGVETTERAHRGHTEGTVGAHEGHTKGDTRGESPTPTPTPTPTPESINKAAEPPEPPPHQPAVEDASTQLDAVPKWAKGHKGTPSAVVLDAVVRSLSAIRQAEVDPSRCKADAAHVVALQRATGTPWDSIAADVALVARWARESSDPLAARDLRAEGWAEGTDRSRSVSTICVQSKWGDRLDAAQRWQAGGAKSGPKLVGKHAHDPPAKARDRPPELTLEEQRAAYEQGQRDHQAYLDAQAARLNRRIKL